MVAAFTLNGTMWFYSAVALITFLVMYFFLPETEGRTIEEAQQFYDRQSLSNDEATSSQCEDKKKQSQNGYGSI